MERLTANYLANGFAFRLCTGRAAAHPVAAIPPRQGAIRPRTPICVLAPEWSPVLVPREKEMSDPRGIPQLPLEMMGRSVAPPVPTYIVLELASVPLVLSMVPPLIAKVLPLAVELNALVAEPTPWKFSEPAVSM